MAIEFNEILESFVAEATDGLADVENDLLALEAGGAEIDADLINKLFRNIHSIKGTAGFCGLRAIGELAHEMENVLNLVRNRELVPTGRIVEQLLRCADMLARMVADVATSNDVDDAARSFTGAVRHAAELR